MEASRSRVVSPRPISSEHRRHIGDVEFGWPGSKISVWSDCGVVKLYHRGMCMGALNSAQARAVADDLGGLLRRAAASVDRAQLGGPR